ncbi:unnamed protein product [Nesidiocoris tenuis]|nr:unnamed protein product [Nesidiocoris tenuis]
MPFLIPNPDGCKDSGLTCPMAADSEGKYELSIPIKQIYPKLKVNVKLELQDQNSQEIICVLIPSKIV